MSDEAKLGSDVGKSTSRLPHGGPAFPSKVQNNLSTPVRVWGEDIHPGRNVTFFGMTLRDYFAAKALSGLCFGRRENVETFAKEAYAIADAMLKARDE